MNIARFVFFFHAISLVAQEGDTLHVEIIPIQATFRSSTLLGLAIGMNGMCYVSDYSQNRVLKIDTTGFVVAEMGGLGSDERQLDGPSDIASADGFNFFVVDANNRRIQRLGRNLEFLGSIQGSSPTIGNANIGRPTAVAVDQTGNLFIADVEYYEILRLNRQRKIDLRYGGATAGAGRITLPHRIAVSHERLAVIEPDRVVVFDYYGQFLFEIVGRELGRPLDIAMGANQEMWVLYPGRLVRYSRIGQRVWVRIVSMSARTLEIRSDLFILQTEPPAILRYRPDYP